MMRKSAIFLSLAFGFLTACSTAPKTQDLLWENPTKAGGPIAFIDLTTAIQSTTDGKEARAKLDVSFSVQKEELKAQREKMNRDHFNIPEEEYKKFDEALKLKQAGIKAEEDRLVQPILSKYKNIIHGIATQNGYAKVIEVGQDEVLEGAENITSAAISQYESKNR